MAQLYTNNATSRLVAPITNVALTLQVSAGTGLLFPNPTGGDFFLLTLYKLVSGIETATEIVKVTTRATDVFTIMRAQEGTAAIAFAESDWVQLRSTAAKATELEAHLGNVSNPHTVTKAQVGLSNADNTSDVNKPISTATQTALDLKQDIDADLTAIAALAPTNDDVIQRKAGAWTNRTMAQVKTDLGLVKADVGLGSVDNTADAAKVVASAASLTTARNIDGQSFNGSANIAVIAPGTVAATDKATPVDADVMPLADSAESNVLKKVSWLNVKATLKTYFDTLYQAAGSYLTSGGALGTPSSGTLTNATGLPPAGVVGTAAILGANTFTGAQIISDQQVSRAMLIDCGHTFLDKGNSSTTLQTLNFTAGSHQRVTATGNHTYAFSNWPPTGNTGFMMFEMTNYGAYTITHPTVNWALPAGGYTTTFSTYMTAVAAAGGAATLQSSGTNFIVYWSRDGGTTIYAKLVA